MENIDFGKLALDLFKSYSDDLLAGLFKTGKTAKKNIRSRLESTYKIYLESLYQSNSQIKTFIITEDPAAIEDFYVPMELQSGDLKIPSANLSSLLTCSKVSIIMGSAGSGKSMLMKMLLLDAIRGGERLPILLEFRQKAPPGASLFDRIQGATAIYGNGVDRDILKMKIERGEAIIFFDGFDELTITDQEALAPEIRRLSGENNGTVVILSCRPDRGVRSWKGFQVFNVNPLSLSSAVELVEKIPLYYDQKARFTAQLKEHLYQRHMPFASNPLLLTVMFIAFRRNPKVTPKTSVFFRNAFEALFEYHDLQKEDFEREMESALDMQDFARVFSAFSFVSYIDRRFEFSLQELRSYIDKAKLLTNKQYRMPSFKSSSFAVDSEKNVALISEDSGVYSFSHRMFQEYFVASFINDSQPEVQKRILDRLTDFDEYHRSDEWVGMLNELNPSLVEQHFVLPIIDRLIDISKIKTSYVGITHFRNFIRWVVPNSRWSGGQSIGDVHVMRLVKRFSVVSKIMEIIASNGVLNDLTVAEVTMVGPAPKKGGVRFGLTERSGRRRERGFLLPSDERKLFDSGLIPFSRAGLIALVEAREILISRSRSFDASFDSLFEQ